LKRPFAAYWIFLFVLLVHLLASICTAACAASPSDRVPPPQFSHETGAYDEAFLLTVTSAANTTVRYTLDGSMPTADSPVFPPDGMVIDDRSGEPNQLASVSTNQITLETDHTPPTVHKGTVIRAAAFSADGRGMSSVLTRTYLVGLYYRDIKVISLVLDSSDLFDYETGIYVLGKTHADWLTEAPGNFQV
jgi:hypothetical protein